MPSDAEAWNRPEGRLRSRYGASSPAGKPPRRARGRQLDPVEGDGVAARGPHAERVPVVVDRHAGRGRRDLDVAVALAAVLAAEAHGGQQHGRRGRHRAEDLVAVDPPAGVGAHRARGRPREVLTGLAHRGGDHDVSRGDRAQRAAERPLAAGVALHARHPPAARQVQDDDQVHVDADRERRVAPGQPARGDHRVVDGAHAESAELLRHRGAEVAGPPQRADALERVAAVAVARRGAGRERRRRAARPRRPAPLPRGSWRGAPSAWLADLRDHVDGDGVGDDVVDDRARLGPLDDLLELLARGVALDRERDADALEPVAVGGVDPGRAAGVEDALERRADLRQRDLAGGRDVDDGQRQAAGERVQQVLRRVGRLVVAEQDRRLAGVDLERRLAGGVLLAGAPEAVDRRAGVGAADPAVVDAELEAGERRAVP